MRAIINKKMRKNTTYVEFVQEKMPGTKLDYIRSPKDAAKIE